MKREILFRGKRKDNGEWVYGVFLKSYCVYVGYEASAAIYDGKRFYEVFPEAIGQFTGLTDKNGVKIFEGDIVRWDDRSKGQYWRVGAIKWVKSHYQIDAYSFESRRPNDKWHSTFNFGCFAYEGDGILEIIGNIHDNPELLK